MNQDDPEYAERRRIDMTPPLTAVSLADRALEEMRRKYEFISMRYDELTFAVETKYDNETRHQTALRFIKAAEARIGGGTPQEERRP